MDEMTSTEFRRRYAKLSKPMIVVALGRQIGVWIPARDGTEIQIRTVPPGQPIDVLAVDEGDRILTLSPLRDDLPAGEYRAGPTFNSRSFAPAPKKRR